MKITVLGTGLMGAPMARRLAGAGHEVTVWNRSREKAEALSDIATVADGAARALSDCDMALSMLIDGSVTEQVLIAEGALRAMAPGTLIVDMGSVGPETDRRLAEAAPHGVSVMDAPVSGGVVGAETGSLVILAGGAEDDFARAQPVFDTLGRATHLGPLGAGQVAKLANQLIVGATIGAVAEGLRLAQAGGCDPAALREALRGGFADSRILELHGARMVAGDFEPGGHSSTQLKDLRNAMTFAKQAGLTLPMGAAARAAYTDFVEEHGGGARDHSAYYEWLDLVRRG